ncbi:hypothetical protein MUO65_04260 [bacterium]|nr:hypothetical protein [bacterium]
MKAEIVLTPPESKRLIAKAVAQMDDVQNALRKGTVIICRGDTNAFIAEEITGQQMEKGQYTAGYIGPKGLGVNPKIAKEIILIDGKLQSNLSMADALKTIKPGDVIIKGANAIGPDGIPAILLGRGQLTSSGGTFGLFQVLAMVRGVQVIVPIGLEKSIPVSVLIGSKEISSSKIDYSQGMPCALIPIFGTVVTEVEAIRNLAGVEALPIATGGIGGAEGSIVLLLKGDESKIKDILKIVEKIKGEPPVSEPR